MMTEEQAEKFLVNPGPAGIYAFQYATMDGRLGPKTVYRCWRDGKWYSSRDHVDDALECNSLLVNWESIKAGLIKGRPVQYVCDLQGKAPFQPEQLDLFL